MNARKIPDLKLEQYLLGELSGKELAVMEQCIAENEDCRLRLAAMERSNREILDLYPPDVMSRRIRSALERSRDPLIMRFLRPRPIASALGAAVAALFFMWVLPGEFGFLGTDVTPSDIRVKGEGPNIKIYRKTPEGSESLRDGATAYPGDLIRIGYQAAGSAYGIILSVDGWGKATMHLPRDGRRAVRLNKDGRVLLDFALELDDAPNWERFYFVTGDTPFDVNPVLEAVGQIELNRAVDQPEELVLPEDFGQFVFSLEKGVHR
jgi:hypothetical protein